MGILNRREFLSSGAVAAGALATGTVSYASQSPTAATRPGSFDFLFITDTHIQPELDAAHGCSMAFHRAASIPADFAIQGGDHVFDALAVDRKRAVSLFDLYGHTEQALGLKVHHAIGNHDHFGIFEKSGVALGTEGYGKQLFVEHVGPTYYSFDHKGYHFVVLDTIQPTPDRSWEARINEEQLTWLKEDLGNVLHGTPVIAVAHVPLITAASQYAAPDAHSGSGVAAASAVVHPQLSVANAWEVLPLLEQHNTLAVLQGHTHINEVIRFRGIQYITSGAVCGNWWHGTRWGIPEGFTVVSLRDGKIEWRYESYGFKSVDPQNT